MNETCGNCKYNRYDPVNESFYCGNTDSEYYGCESFYEDTCDEWEERT